MTEGIGAYQENVRTSEKHLLVSAEKEFRAVKGVNREDRESARMKTLQFPM